MKATEPPADTGLPPLDRRTLLKGGALGAGLLGAPLSAQNAIQGGGRGFTHGVASGEPGGESVLLWTRFVAPQEVPLTVEVAEDNGFTRVVYGGKTVAVPDHDHCAKALAVGLAPGQWYYYRFIAPDGSISDIGRTRTLPRGKVNRFRMAVFSCANIGFGWFNAYAHAAEANDVDLVLHLGDYFYEYAPGTYPSNSELVPGRALWTDHEAIALADYRARFAQYRSDADLRRLHQLYPMIAGWDDHEIANDTWSGGAENHQSETEGEWSVRKAAAERAYREWMPVSDEPFAAYDVGDLATLFRLETRHVARGKPIDLSQLIAGKTSPQDMVAALAAFRQGDYLNPSREMIGGDQQGWLAHLLKTSRAEGKVWQVLVQQVLMGQTATPTALASLVGDGLPDYVRKRLMAGVLASQAGLPMNMDAWDGYPAARARLLEAALAADANLISLAGDTHNAWAFDLAHDGAPVGVEFGGQSVSSPGFEHYLPQVPSADLARAVVGHNPQLKWADLSQRGYMAVELTPERATSEYRFVGNVRERSAKLAGTHRVTALAGQRRLDIG